MGLLVVGCSMLVGCGADVTVPPSSEAPSRSSATPAVAKVPSPVLGAGAAGSAQTTSAPEVASRPATTGAPLVASAQRERDIAELVERLAPRLSRSTEDLQPVARPGGGMHLDLQGRFHHASVARLGADGALQHVCVESPQALQAALQAAPNSPD